MSFDELFEPHLLGQVDFQCLDSIPAALFLAPLRDILTVWRSADALLHFPADCRNRFFDSGTQ